MVTISLIYLYSLTHVLNTDLHVPEFIYNFGGTVSTYKSMTQTADVTAVKYKSVTYLL